MRDPSDMRWKKPSRSGAGNNCVEVADLDGGCAVRDSKNPTGPALMFTATEWAAFTAGVRAGEFD
jgi:uncharacterized protein DUF397